MSFLTLPMIFSIGLPKTGTSSIATNLMAMGLRGMPFFGRPVEIEMMYGAKKAGTKAWDFANGMPFWHRFEQFDRDFPGSLFILTVREGTFDQWFESYQQERAMQKANKQYYPDLWTDWYDEYRVEALGSSELNRDKCEAVWANHNNKVLRHFMERPDQLLLMDVIGGQKYETLCPFIGVEPPQAMPWLHANRRLQPGQTKR